MKRSLKKLSGLFLTLVLTLSLFPMTALAVVAPASIGTTDYVTLDAALAAAADGDTVTLNVDFIGANSYTSTITINNKTLTLDLHGHTLDVVVASSAGLSLTYGTLNLTGGGSLNVTGQTEGVYACASTVSVTTAKATGDGTSGVAVFAAGKSNVTVTDSVTATCTGGIGVFTDCSRTPSSDSCTVTVGGMITTSSIGVYTDGASSNVTVNGNITATGDSCKGIWANGGTVLVNANVSATDVGCVGVCTKSASNVTVMGTVSSVGNYSRGASIEGNGSNVTVNGNMTATGASSIGVYLEASTVTANSNISVSGDDCIGICTNDKGCITVTGNVSASGMSSYGISAKGSSSTINVDGSLSATDNSVPDTSSTGVFIGSAGNNHNVITLGDITLNPATYICFDSRSNIPNLTTASARNGTGANLGYYVYMNSQGLAPDIVLVKNKNPIFNTTTGKGYATLSNALSEATNGDTVLLTKAITESASATVDSSKTVTIDGQGFTITGTTSSPSAALSLSGAGTVVLKNVCLQGGAADNSYGLHVSGSVNVQSIGTVTAIGNSGSFLSYGLLHNGTGIVTITSGSGSCSDLGYSAGIRNDSTGTINVNSADGQGKNGCGVMNCNVGTVNVATATGSSSAILNMFTGTVNATNATGATSYDVENNQSGTVNVKTPSGGAGKIHNLSNSGTVNTGADVATLTLNKGTGASCVLDSITVAKTGTTTIGALPEVYLNDVAGSWYTDAAKSTLFSGTTVTAATTLYSSFYTAPTTGGCGGSSGGSSGSSSDTDITSSTAGNVTTEKTTLTGTISNGIQAAPVPSATMESLTDAAKKTEAAGGAAVASIALNTESGVNDAKVTIPGTQFNAFASGTSAALQFTSSLATVTFSSNAVDAIAAAGSGDVTFDVKTVDKSALSPAQQEAVGDRPVYSFSVTVGNTTVSQFGGTVTVTLPYTPKAGEDPNAIVIYYVDADGQLQPMQGNYDAASGTVTFETSHFSDYIIGYNKIDFDDVSTSAWYYNAVTFLAARGITTGTADGVYSPDATLTRGQFITLLMRAQGVSAGAASSDNFSDAGDTYYTPYLSVAKQLGISNGVGDNVFAPDQSITRQEMFTMLFNGLKAIGKLPTGTSGKILSDFTDASSVSSWAADAMTAFLKAGTVSGSDGKLSPTAATTRAEMAQVLYSLLGK